LSKSLSDDAVGDVCFCSQKHPILKVWELRLDEKGQLPDLGYEHRGTRTLFHQPDHYTK
jgi:hypothetical protein